MITSPGIYDIPADEYHADPVEGGSLSSTGARLLLPPSCPARFRYEQDNPTPPTPTFDLGHAAHRVVLGDGPEFCVIVADDYRTKAAREARDEAHANGQVPLLAAEYQQVLAMADAVRLHPIAGALFDPDRGRPEMTLVWQDKDTEIMCRAMLDWLPYGITRRMIVPDYKTAASASPSTFARSVATYGYHQQAPWYLDGITALGLDSEPVFVFVVQEKTPPYLVAVFELDDNAIRIGADRNRRAREIYRDCKASNIWPGYTTDVELIALPRWAERQHEETFVD